MITEYLDKEGYKSHIFGKWHLGFCSESYTPTHRGFDSFDGLYVSLKKYEELRSKLKSDSLTGEHFVKHVERKEKGKNRQAPTSRSNHVWDRIIDILYEIRLKEERKRPTVITSEYYLTKVEEVLADHDGSLPFFFYLSLFTKYYNKYKEVNVRVDRPRILKNMDDTVGKVVDMLKQSGHYNNTIILFMSDNGGRQMPKDILSPNFPLRGYKGSVYEGGTKIPAFIHSPLLNSTGYRCVNSIK